MKFLILSLIFCSQFVSPKVFATPAQVVIIRHAEKPDSGNELSPQGWLRAKALPQFFNNNKIVNQFGIPAAIYAGAPKKNDGSVRSIQTVTPYAQSLGMNIHQDFNKDQFETMVEEVLNNDSYKDRTVIICWEHNDIPEIAHLFGASDAPDKWQGGVFDRAWVIQFQNEKVSNYLDLPQHLLPSDSIK